MSWAEERERGHPWLVRAALAAARLGWPAGRALAWASAGWFLLSAREARAASAQYLGRVLGRRATRVDVARHFDAFAVAVLDRVMLLTGQERRYAIEVEGLEGLLATLESGRGAILLGSHLGSFEVLRTLARRAPVPVWALMYRRNGGALTRMLDRAAPQVRERVLEIGDTASLIQARECVARGEIVGILGDRGPPGHRGVGAPFLGGVASFPSGPFVLASTLAAPVFLCHAVNVGRRRYRIGIAPFADRVVLRRERRQEDLRFQVESYAAALEILCRAHPYQWFNFFPFWESDDARSDPAQPGGAAPPAVRAARTG